MHACTEMVFTRTPCFIFWLFPRHLNHVSYQSEQPCSWVRRRMWQLLCFPVQLAEHVIALKRRWRSFLRGDSILHNTMLSHGREDMQKTRVQVSFGQQSKRKEQHRFLGGQFLILNIGFLNVSDVKSILTLPEASNSKNLPQAHTSRHCFLFRCQWYWDCLQSRQKRKWPLDNDHLPSWSTKQATVSALWNNWESTVYLNTLQRGWRQNVQTLGDQLLQIVVTQS